MVWRKRQNSKIEVRWLLWGLEGGKADGELSKISDQVKICSLHLCKFKLSVR